jgi:CHAT domain-containing protein
VCRVDDYSTSLLMGAFNRSHLGKGLSIDRALRIAQRWVRSLTWQTLRARVAWELEAVEQALDGASMEPADERLREALRELLGDLDGYDGHVRPFAHPFFWAAFTAIGAAG